MDIARVDTRLNNATSVSDEYDFMRGARRQDATPDDIDNAKYAFCAAVDEIILRSPYAIREEWARRPLQLVLFGDQPAGGNRSGISARQGLAQPKLHALALENRQRKKVERSLYNHEQDASKKRITTIRFRSAENFLLVEKNKLLDCMEKNFSLLPNLGECRRN